MTKNIYTCDKCEKTFTSSRSVNAHMSIHSGRNYPIGYQQKESNSQYGTMWISNFHLQKSMKINKLDIHQFLKEGWIPKRVINFSLYDSYGNIIPKQRKEYPHTKIYRNACPISGKIWFSKLRRKFHPDSISIKECYYKRSQFLFSISKFPLWFDGELIKELGWYSSVTRNNININLTGVSRDHRISRSYGFKNNIDPWYISHPANCQLMVHADNNSKHMDSSIDLNQLKEDIKKFESIYPEYQHFC